MRSCVGIRAQGETYHGADRGQRAIDAAIDTDDRAMCAVTANGRGLPGMLAWYIFGNRAATFRNSGRGIYQRESNVGHHKNIVSRTVHDDYPTGL